MNLHYECVTKELHDLLLQLMRVDELSAFRMVGGTALALQLGHRRSVDIDIFTDAPFASDKLEERLVGDFGLQRSAVATNSVAGMINGIKVDAIAHRYTWLDDALTIDGIRIASLRDLAAMKLNAVANRGCKKDFWDIAALLDRFSPDELLSFFTKRYPHVNDWQVVRSLTYFDDAESDPDPVVLNGLTWRDVKNRLKKYSKDFLL
jgi:hypothetical protein